jgi:hypothetical protein
MQYFRLGPEQTRGSVLPIALIVLTVMTMLGAAAFEAARFGAAAASGQMAAAAAFHAADTGIETYVSGTGPVVGSFRLKASWGEARVTSRRLMLLADSSWIVHVQSEGAAPSDSMPVGRRHLEVLVSIPLSGPRQRVGGSWTERM